MKVVLKYVENNYADKISIADIADVAGFSESHFMRYFKETMGTSFVDYLKDYRLTMAARLCKAQTARCFLFPVKWGLKACHILTEPSKALWHDTSAVPQGQLTPL